MPMRVCKSYCVSCPQEDTGNARIALALRKSDHVCNLVRMSILSKVRALEIEVKSQQQFTDVQVGAQRRSSVGVHPVVFVVPGKAGATGHERVVPVPDGEGGDIAQVGGRRPGGKVAVGGREATREPRHATRSVRL